MCPIGTRCQIQAKLPGMEKEMKPSHRLQMMHTGMWGQRRRRRETHSRWGRVGHLLTGSDAGRMGTWERGVQNRLSGFWGSALLGAQLCQHSTAQHSCLMAAGSRSHSACTELCSVSHHRRAAARPHRGVFLARSLQVTRCIPLGAASPPQRGPWWGRGQSCVCWVSPGAPLVREEQEP